MSTKNEVIDTSPEVIKPELQNLLTPPQPKPANKIGSFLRRNPRLFIGGTILVILITIAVIAPLLPLPNPERGRAVSAYQPPSAEHWLGTDATGRDVLARVIYGARISLSVGLIAVLIGGIVGGGLGLLAGWRGGWFDTLVMRFVDGLLAFPTLLLAISITAALGPRLENAMIAIGVINIPVFARLARGQTLQAKKREYIEAAQAIGIKPSRILRAHILPNILNPLVIQASLSLAAAILAEASLSFLGLGAQPPTPTWGADINTGRAWLSKNYWWMVIGPGMAIMLTVYAFNLLGDGIRDLLDPRMRRQR
jgi:peptide/nickel transport system permease protein